MKPSYDDVLRMLEERRQILATMHQAMEIDENWFDAGTSDEAKARVAGTVTGLPARYAALKLPPLAYLGVMVGVNQVHVGESIEAKWRIPDDGTYEEAERKAREAKMNRWLSGLIYMMDTFSTDSVIREVVTKLIALGMSCITYSIDYDRWEDPPFGWVKGKGKTPKEPRGQKDREVYNRWRRKRGRAFPFNISAVHPRNLFFDPHHAVPEDYIREEIISWDEAKKIAPEIAERQPVNRPIRGVTRVTYCSSEWVGQWLNGEPVTEMQENTAGLPMHRMAFGGFGSTVRNGDFASKGKGVIRDGLDLIKMKVVLLNILERMRGVTAFPPIIVDGDDPQERKLVADSIKYGPGEILEKTKQVTIGEFPEIHVPNVVFQQMDQVDALLETHFGPAILRGQAQAQETAQGQRNRFTIATSIYRAAQQAAQQMVAAVLLDLAYLVKYELQEPCPVTLGDGTVATIGPADIDDGASCMVDFTPPTEDEKAFKAENDRKDLEMGIITAEEYAERQGYPNPQAQIRSVRVQKLVDMVLGSEAIGGLLTNKLIESVGGPVAPPAGPPPGGAPPTAGGMPPVQATPSGQTMQAEPGTIAGNPEQQLATTNVAGTFPAPV